MEIMNTMHSCFDNFLLFLTVILVSSCNGQNFQKEKKVPSSTQIEFRATKIPVPKNGFSNAYVDKDGTIWFSSNGGGVFHYDGQGFKNYTVENGLSSNQVFSIISDEDENLWFGTQNGLIKLKH